jgi:alpha-galactosidase
LWCILNAPLMAGNDLRSMTPEIKEILTNQEVLAINQDELGRQASRVWKEDDLEIWAKPMKDGSRAVLLLNRGTSETPITVPWTVLGYPDHLTAAIRDLWAHKLIGKFTGKFPAKVPSHDVVVLSVKP